MTDLQVALDGKKFKLYRWDTATAAYGFVCLAATKALNRTKTFDEYMVVDCDAPDDAPWQGSMVTGRSWSMPISGIVDAARFRTLETDWESDAAVQYQMRTDLAAVDGGQTYTGNVHIENLEMTSQDKGVVRFTATLRGDGPLTRAAAAA